MINSNQHPIWDNEITDKYQYYRVLSTKFEISYPDTMSE